MKLHHIGGDCYYFSGAVNIGYVQKDGYGILIDAGLESSTIKKVLKILDRESLPLNSLIITHAHADHFGGAAYLQKNRDITIYAPSLEAAIMENPILEPIYLFNGTVPINSMRNKFIEGEPIKVDHLIFEGAINIGSVRLECIHLPGHSYNQFGVIIDGYLYAADAYFGLEQLEKHKIPYIVDAGETLNSLERIMQLKLNGAIPGHGNFELDYINTVQKNIDWHQEVLTAIETRLRQYKTGIRYEEFQKVMCEDYGVELRNATSWMLYRTALTAYITKLMNEQTTDLVVKDNELLIVYKKEGEA